VIFSVMGAFVRGRLDLEGLLSEGDNSNLMNGNVVCGPSCSAAGVDLHRNRIC